MSKTLHIYTRVSTATQEEQGTSLESQKELGIKKAEQLGFDYKLWNEGGRSSSRDDFLDRPVLVSLLNKVEKGEIKHLFVFNTDRLSRNETTWSTIKIQLIKASVTLHTSQGEYPLADPMNKMMLGIMSEFSAYDNQIRAERSRLGKLNRVQQGFWHGGPPPYGYKIENKKLVVEETEAKWVKFIFELYNEGESIDFIKGELLKNSALTRRGNIVWSLGSIEKLLSNTHYSGYYTYKDKKEDHSIHVDCPPIVPSQLYLDVKNIREKRSYKKRRSESRQKHFYMLKDFLVCHECGCHYSGRHFPKQYRSVYYCPRKERNFVNKHTDREMKCQNKRYLKIQETDELVWNTVTDILSNSHLFKEEIKRESLGQSLFHKDKNKKIQDLQKDIKTIRIDIKNIREAIVKIQTDMILNQPEHHNPGDLIKSLNQRLLESRATEETIQTEIHALESEKNWIDWVSEFSNRIDDMSSFTPQEKHRFLQGVLEQVVVKTLDKQTHELHITLKTPYVNDKLIWNDDKKKSKGYALVNGDSKVHVDIDTKKKHIPETETA